MRMRRYIVAGIAAAALGITAGGVAGSYSSGGRAPASVSVQPALAPTPVTDEEAIAALKRHINWRLVLRDPGATATARG